MYDNKNNNFIFVTNAPQYKEEYGTQLGTQCAAAQDSISGGSKIEARHLWGQDKIWQCGDQFGPGMQNDLSRHLEIIVRVS